MPPRQTGPGAREVVRSGGRDVPAGVAPVPGLPREHVSEIQRMRILAAMADVAAERGAGSVTVAHVVARAGVSRRTFYDLFADREECFLAAFEEAIGRVGSQVIEAYEHESAWREQIRAGLWALLVFLDEEPATARLCIVESLAAGPRVLERRAVVMRALVGAIDEGRAAVPKRATQPPPLTAEGVVGAVLSVIHTRLSEANPRPLSGLLGELMSVIVLPYLGQASAQKELGRPAPKLKTKTAHVQRDPLEGLDMRITYRTVRVLMVIASYPDASNRKIASEAGISDQGQVSKLLARLEHLGLIYNRGIGPVKGAPNAWQLTARGRHVEQAIRVQTTPG
ncbi:MAG TPA: TetR family transcriptional regulator [Solirubrobacteraceae bacterium]|nr:TetR family transcriptional regulator [Solirubrobacteraceae bacterium]